MLGHVASSVGGALPGTNGSPTINLGSRQTTVYTPGSYTWTAPADGLVIAAVKGGGATGYKATSSGAGGGGGGGYCRKQFPVIQGQQLTIFIAPARLVASGNPANGIDGSSSTLSASGITMIAEGGKGATMTGVGGLGGGASGGDVNATGGAGAISPSAGQAGVNGYAGGSGSTSPNCGGGGGAAGDINDEFDALLPTGVGGNGQGGGVGGAGGGQGGHGNNYTGTSFAGAGAGFLVFQEYMS